MTTDNTTTNPTAEILLQQIGKNTTQKVMNRQEIDGKLIVGSEKYNALKSIPIADRKPSQLALIKDFEDYHGITEYLKNLEQYKANLNRRLQAQEQAVKNLNITPRSLLKAFKRLYLQTYKKEFVHQKGKAFFSDNLCPVILYFARDERFLNYGAKDENGIFLSQPSFDKGLLLIGDYGNGKSSIMHTMQLCMRGVPDRKMGRFSTIEVVNRYETANKNKNWEVLDYFWNTLLKPNLYLDDLKAEPDAKSFGAKNLLNLLLQERYNKGLLTHGTCNFDPRYPKNVKEALNEFKIRYSPQVYDRLFEMFNIIVFNGKSYRR